MARFSLSPPSSSIRKPIQPSQTPPQSLKSPPQWKWNFPPQDQYYRGKSPSPSIDGDDSSVSSDESEDTYSSEESESEIEEVALPREDSDDDDDYYDEEEEPPHPLGFESRYGRTRFGLSPQSTLQRNSSSVPPRDIFDKDNEYAWNALIHIDDRRNGRNKMNQQSFPPIGSGSSYHLNRDGSVSTKKLLYGASSHSQHKEEESMEDLLSGMDRIANLVKAASYVAYDENYQQRGTSFSTPPHTTVSLSSQLSQQNSQPRSTSKLLQLAHACERQQASLSLEMNRLQQQRAQSHKQSCQGFLMLLQADASRVSSANDRITKRQQQIAALEEQERLDKQAYEEQLRLQMEEAKRAEEERIAAEAARSEEERRKERERLEQLRQAEEEAELEAKKKNEHVERATSLIANLEQVRSGLKEFDKSKAVSRRRLQFKKICNGKINTLSHDKDKVVEVGKAVSDAIAKAASDDAAGGEPVTSMGKKYLLDLLCANLIVRVQADGFNGTRGDGFPLAAMFAFVSTHCEEISPVLEGHLYTVCPTAIPTLSLTEATSEGGVKDENDLMESLGMIRDKDGEFESFDKFLHRTEGLISIMANIMSSLPSEHTLLGGHRGALTWLQRFMALLPPSPASPLPLLTAPVLVAFLTGAGHMLANKYPTEFKPIFDEVKKDIVNRLDDSPVGVPSATRLKKVLEVGFDGLKKDLPQGSIAALYDGRGTGAGATGGVSSSPFGATPGAASNTSNTTSSNPLPTSNWGGNATSDSDSMFDAKSASSTVQADTTTSAQSSSAAPFGNSSFSTSNTAAASNPSPFGTVGGQPTGFAAAAPSPFGGGGSQNPGFGTGFGTTPAPAASPFGSASAAPSSGFGTSTAPAPSPFGAAPAAPSSGFGTSSAPAPSPFGAAPAAPSSGFGASAAPAPSPFGAAAPASTGFGSSPFSTASQQAPSFGSSPFGMNTSSAPSPSPFGGGSGSGGNVGGQGGGKKPPCKFFAKGKCNFGDRCKFSHDIGGAGSSNPAPFGNPSGGQSSNTFGSGGGGNNDKKQPCKFFASGKCRNGDRCRFSHEIGGNATNSTFGTFGSSTGFSQSNNPSPFAGGGGGFGNTGFGASPSPFGSSAPSSNAFGGPRR